jgi:hypothetical protein
MSTTSSCLQCTSLSAKQICPLGHMGGVIEVPTRLFCSSIFHPTTVIYTATGTIAPADLFNTCIVNTGAAGGITLTLPATADVIAAFLLNDIVLKVGDSFSVLFTAITAQSITIGVPASMSTAAATNLVIPASKSAILYLTLTSATAFEVHTFVSA